MKKIKHYIYSLLLSIPLMLCACTNKDVKESDISDAIYSGDGYQIGFKQNYKFDLGKVSNQRIGGDGTWSIKDGKVMLIIDLDRYRGEDIPTFSGSYTWDGECLTHENEKWKLCFERKGYNH